MSEQKFPVYKDKPLVRSGDVLYYGDMSESYVVRMQVKSTKKVGDLNVADKVTIQLMSTDENLSARRRIVKSTDKQGIYFALDTAEFWLRKALTSSQKQ